MANTVDSGESLVNIRAVCHECANRKLGSWDDKPPEWFIGKHIKMRFREGGHTENMWVRIDGFDGLCLTGMLDNAPVLITTIQHGDQVMVDQNEILDVLE